MPTHALSWSNNGECIAISGENFMSLYTRNGTFYGENRWRMIILI